MSIWNLKLSAKTMKKRDLKHSFLGTIILHLQIYKKWGSTLRPDVTDKGSVLAEIEKRPWISRHLKQFDNISKWEPNYFPKGSCTIVYTHIVDFRFKIIPLNKVTRIDPTIKIVFVRIWCERRSDVQD